VTLSLSADRLCRQGNNRSREDKAKSRNTRILKGPEILESKTLSDDEVVLSVFAAGGEDKVQKISMKRYGAEWRMAGPKIE
jgi:hypothetical protein